MDFRMTVMHIYDTIIMDYFTLVVHKIMYNSEVAYEHNDSHRPSSENMRCKHFFRTANESADDRYTRNAETEHW